MKKYLFHGKNVERMLENQEKIFPQGEIFPKLTKSEKLKLGIGLGLIFAGYIALASLDYQDKIRGRENEFNHTNYTSIVQSPESAKSLADSLNWKEK